MKHLSNPRTLGWWITILSPLCAAAMLACGGDDTAGTENNAGAAGSVDAASDGKSGGPAAGGMAGNAHADGSSQGIDADATTGTPDARDDASDAVGAVDDSAADARDTSVVADTGQGAADSNLDSAEVSLLDASADVEAATVVTTDAEAGAVVTSDAEAGAVVTSDAETDAVATIDVTSSDAGVDGNPPDGSDATTGADGDGAADAPPPCDKTAVFGTLQPIPGVNSTTQTDSAWLSPDALSLYVSAVRADAGPGGYDLYKTSRTSTSLDFGPLSLLANVNGPTNDRTLVMSADGLTIAFDTLRDAPKSNEIYMAKRATLNDDFGQPFGVDFINTTSGEDPGSFSADGKTFYFSSGGHGGLGLDDNFQVDIDNAGQFSNIKALTSINSAEAEASAVVSADGLTVYFASKRVVTGALGSYDIFVARRASKTDDFGPPTLTPELNSALADFPTWMSPDECTIVVASPRAKSGFNYDVYWAKR